MLSLRGKILKKKRQLHNTLRKVKTSMKSRFKNLSKKQLFVGASFALAFVGIGAWTLITTFAAPYEIYISPGSGDVSKGQEFDVSLRIDPGTSVDGVTATISYDTSILEFVAIDTSNSAFPVSLEQIGGAGAVVITRGIFAPSVVSSDSLVANVTFRALAASSGPSVIGLSGNASYAGSYTNPQPISATVTVVDPGVIPNPGTSDTELPTITISSPEDGATIKRKENLVATATDNVGVVAMQVTLDGAVVANSSTGEIKYSVNLSSKRIAKGAHDLTVKAVDAAGNEATASITVYK